MTKRSLTFEDLLPVVTPCGLHHVALSPDGRYFAAALHRASDIEEPALHEFETGAGVLAAGAEVWLTDLQDEETWKIGGDGGRSWGPSWSPDGSRVVYFADHTGRVNLWCWDRDSKTTTLSSEAQVFAHMPIDKPRWSPDSRRVFLNLRPEGWKHISPKAPETNVTAVTVHVSHSARENSGPAKGFDFTKLPEQNRDVGVVDVVEGRTERLLTGFPSMSILPSYQGDWLAILTSGRQPDITTLRTVQDLYIMPARGGNQVLVADGLQAGTQGRYMPAWSPINEDLAFTRDGDLLLYSLADETARKLGSNLRAGSSLLLWDRSGKWLICTSESEASDETELWLVSVEDETATPRRLAGVRGRATVLRRNDATWFWSPDDQSCVLLTRNASTRGGEFWRVPLDGGDAELLLSDRRKVTFIEPSPSDTVLGDVSSDGSTVVFGMEDEAHPPDFFSTNKEFRDLRQLTRLNPDLERFDLGKSQLICWNTTEGSEVYGALLLPPDYQEGKPVPVVVEIYPDALLSNRLNRWDWEGGLLHAQLLAAKGYGFLSCDLPGVDSVAPDARPGLAGTVLPGINELVRVGIADPERLALIGHSQGSFAVNRIITETARFKAAVSASGPGNPAAEHGKMTELPSGESVPILIAVVESWFGGPPSKMPLRYVQGSPVFNLDKVETALLLIYGTEDYCGVEQGEEMFVGLKQLGKEVTLLRYRGEGHIPSRFSPPNHRDMVSRVLEFLDAHL